MSIDILVNAAPGETRIAQIENGQLQELFMQRDSQRGVVGNIYLGKVQRVLPGMQAAFVEIGLERTAFLHASDIVYERGDDAQPCPGIERLLCADDHVPVQVFKEPLGSKGARLTTDLSIASRYLVYMPRNEKVAISVRIENEAERERLLQVITQSKQAQQMAGGFIVRTAGEGASEAALAADMQFLQKLWTAIQQKITRAQPPSLVHGDLPLITRMLRDLLTPSVDRIRIDSPAAHQQMHKFAQEFVPELAARIELYEGDNPIFDLYGAEDELERALHPRVLLKSGGSIVIEQTEAMITIDVNTGGFVGAYNLGDTILKTNLEAAQAIARQLRLRNLGGIIIIDFIDMQNEGHRDKVLRALETALTQDPAKNMICDISQLGLVEMTRKRTRESLEHLLCEPCAQCEGRGSVKTVETICHDIFRELVRSAHQFESEELLVLANPDVIAMLLDEQATALAELSEALAHPIRLQAESLYLQEYFDVVLM